MRVNGESALPPDHPRSRGVYPVIAVEETDEDGSSPLARGLPKAIPGKIIDGGIIPARAGFTRFRTGRRSVARDHPRSRGVYSWTASPVPATWGSSPLARGLPAKAMCEPRVSGIIPARAGFTR